MSDWRFLAMATASICFVGLGAFVLSRRFMPKTPLIPATPESFARLIVAEMALYHRGSLDRARSQKAIYRMLKEDIDRSRKMFLARFPDSEPAFYAALVATLARGNPESLGADYPYERAPRV